jgi:hypothetical protein
VVVTVPDTGVDENAVMIGPGDAALTNIAVLGPWWLDEFTSAAFVAGVKERHVVSMILTSDVAWICGASEVQQHVRHDDCDKNGGLGEEADLGPYLRKVQVLGYGHDQDKEDLESLCKSRGMLKGNFATTYHDCGMTIIHETIEQPYE